MATIASPFSSSQNASSLALQLLVPTSLLASTALVYTYKGQLANFAVSILNKSLGKATGKGYLSGNFAPVHEEVFSDELEITGTLPKHLDGLYVRTGPNPYFKPVKGYHWFDGDGMLHGVRISKGKAAYANHQVRTTRLAQEQSAGRPLFIKFGDIFGLPGLAMLMLDKLRIRLGGISTKQGSGTANTALVYHARRLLALHEGDLPYSIKVACNGVLDTLGRVALDIDWKGPFTAHPKLDAETGELLFFGYNFDTKPFMNVGVMDKDGHVIRKWGVDLPYPTMMHDCAITKDYFVVMHLPFIFDPEQMVKHGSLPFRLDKSKPGRIGLLRRDSVAGADGLAAVQWFELPGPGFMAFHVSNAWQEKDGTVKVYACQQDSISLDLDTTDMSQELARMHEYTLCPASGTASARCLSEVRGDFPVVAPRLVGRACKYTWVGQMDTSGSMPSFIGIVKMDLTTPPAKDGKPAKDAGVGRISFPAGCYGGEAVFVPRDPNNKSADNDDGHLMVYVYNNATDATTLNVYDARSMAEKPVASIQVGRRVPYGFHGTWVTQEQIASQAYLA